MITVTTDAGTHTFNAKPEDVTQTGPVLKIASNGQIIGTFRRWTAWFENPESETP